MLTLSGTGNSSLRHGNEGMSLCNIISPALEIKDDINHVYQIATITVFRESSGENERKCNHTEVIFMKNALTLCVIDSYYINCEQVSKS